MIHDDPQRISEGMEEPETFPSILNPPCLRRTKCGLTILHQKTGEITVQDCTTQALERSSKPEYSPLIPSNLYTVRQVLESCGLPVEEIHRC